LKRGELGAWEFSKESEAIVGVERILEVKGDRLLSSIKL
jgi:hypothetical protein